MENENSYANKFDRVNGQMIHVNQGMIAWFMNWWEEISQNTV